MTTMAANQAIYIRGDGNTPHNEPRKKISTPLGMDPGPILVAIRKTLKIINENKEVELVDVDIAKEIDGNWETTVIKYAMRGDADALLKVWDQLSKTIHGELKKLGIDKDVFVVVEPHE
ncbi:hypothetical protein Tneu_0959 [Pyrobaculum neutrophilum V24Sta]|uniref:Uncharacterized protein n=1 Tax=Pyrobaculum neutrophilum (strain DSM 2338 / JCM 9278 / NBRC 100436 / V24Sta) TaxID=444157 RepID=B1YDN1_PYRNV|nr:hypothetical protein Tneu_0959 [Pyrobaculum neutrophilum V24Sta]